jgi:hypothetical protein
MKTLTIKDLSIAADLDTKALASVRGGCGYSMPSSCYTPSYCSPSSWGGPQFDVTKNDFNFNASQQLGQSQNTVVNNGNNVAFASGITSNVAPSQSGHNSINFG